MTGYEEFQRILAELKRKVGNDKKIKNINLPPGFEELFKNIRK